MHKIDLLSNQVINDLNTKLNWQQQISNKQCFTIIETALSHAFSDLEAVDRKKLYRKLALSLHPDKLASSNEPFAVVLKKFNCIDSAQKILETLKEEVPLEPFADLQYSSTDRRYRLLLSIYIILRVEVLLEKLEKYPKPIAAFMEGLLNTSIDIIVKLILILPDITFVPGHLTLILFEKITNLLTNNQLEINITHFKMSHPTDDALLKKQVINKLKSDEYYEAIKFWQKNNHGATEDQIEQESVAMYQHIFSMKDDVYLNKKSPFTLENEMRNAILESTYYRFKLTIRAFQTRIASLLKGNISQTTIKRGGILLSAVILIPTVAIKIINKIVELLPLIITSVLLGTALMSVLLLLSVPAYVYEYLERKYHSFHRSEEEKVCSQSTAPKAHCSPLDIITLQISEKSARSQIQSDESFSFDAAASKEIIARIRLEGKISARTALQYDEDRARFQIQMDELDSAHNARMAWMHVETEIHERMSKITTLQSSEYSARRLIQSDESFKVNTMLTVQEEQIATLRGENPMASENVAQAWLRVIQQELQEEPSLETSGASTPRSPR